MADFTRVYHRKAYDAISPSLPELSQHGRTVLITGGSEGIGLSIAEHFLAAGAADIILASRKQAVLDTAAAHLESKVDSGKPTKIHTLTCDVGDRSSISSLWSKLAELGLQPDTLILNAASVMKAESADEVAQVFQVNMDGNLRMLQAFTAQGPKTGKIAINISSMAAHMNPALPGLLAYSSSKAAFTSHFSHVAQFTPVEECLMVTLHPGAILTSNARRSGFDENSMDYDHVDLPGAFSVWVTKQTFLHGRFVWVHWDAEELVSMKEKILADSGMLRIGLQGVGSVDIVSTFKRIAEKTAP